MSYIPEIRECYRDNFCCDCDNTACGHCGDIGADCPRWTCIYPTNSEQYEDCSNCQWIKDWMEEMKK